MKRLRKLFVVLMSLSLTSCGFVNYVEGSSYVEQSIVNEITTKRNEYIQKLDETYLEENYEINEKAQLRKCLIEAKAELRECNSVTELEETFKKNKDVINSIKTKNDYATELAAKKKEYLEKIDDISNESLYREKEKETYLFYIKKAKEAINGLGSIKEDFDKVYNAYKNIIEAIKTDAEYVKEEADAFEKYKLEAIDEINTYLNLDDYRETESNSIKGLLDSAVNNIKEAEEYADVGALVRKYKTDVYQYETDAELYNKELLSLIDESKSEISSYVNTTNYRDNEVTIINSLLEAFNKDIGDIKVKEEVTKLVGTYKGLFDSIKTDAELYEEEKQLLTDNLFESLKELVQYEDLSDEEKAYYDKLYAVIKQLDKKEDVENLVNEEKIKGYETGAKHGNPEALVQYQMQLIEGLHFYLDKSLYREEQQDEIESIITNSYGSILSCTNYDDTIDALNTIKTDLDDVLTNDEMWEKEDVEFFETLHALYGDDILIPEGSLTEASDYYELANIVDYYAFYQLDANSFVRDTFRVKLNFTWSSAQNIKINTYWKCKLIHMNSGMECKMDNDYLIITLIPYNVASKRDEYYVSNEERHTTNYIYSNLESISPRTMEEFSFANNQRIRGIWNTNQLWFALEKNYFPVCVQNSIADYSLNKMIEILSSINNEDMGMAKKAFNIYQWIGNNNTHNNCFSVDIHYEDSVDLDNFPDEIPSLYRETCLEGPLFDGYSVCYGCAKLMLSLLKIEGIEAHLFFIKKYSIENNPTINWVNNGRAHAMVLMKIDNNWFYSDPSFSNFTNGQGIHYLNFSNFIVSKYEGGNTETELDISALVSKDTLVYDQIYEEIYNERNETVYCTDYAMVDSILSSNLDYLILLSRLNLKNYIYENSSYYVNTLSGYCGESLIHNYLLIRY